MKELLVVISSMGYGGAEMQTLGLANDLVDLDYAIDIVVLDHKKEIINQARPEIRFHILNKNSYLDIAVLRKLKLIIREKNPDIILCVDLYPALYVRLALGVKAGSYCTATVFHCTLPKNIKEKFQRLYLVPVVKSLDQFIFVSKNQMEYWVKGWNLNRDRAAVIHNGIDIERFASYLQNEEEISVIKAKCGFEDKDTVIGTCSDFRQEKRHKDLIEVCANLREKGYPVKLLLIGDGYMRRNLEEQIRSKQLENEVIITGLVADVRPYLAAIDIFALTSDSVETLSIAAIESQAMKKAVVLSNIGGASEIANDGINGFLYPACNVDVLMEKLEVILKEKKWITMGEAGHRHASLFFDKNLMVRSYDRLLQNM